MAEVQPVQLSQFVQTQNVAHKEPEKVQEKPKLTTPQKVMAGAAILGATIAAGLGIRHGIKIKKFNEAYEKLYSNISKSIESDKKCSHPDWFDYEALTERFNQAAKSARESRNLESLSFYDGYILNCRNAMTNRQRVIENFGENIDIAKFDEHLKQVMETAEKNKSIQLFESFNSDVLKGSREISGALSNGKIEIIDKDFFRTLEELKKTKLNDFQNYVDTRLGGTIEESLEKIYGKNSGIKRHTYDLSKEGNDIAYQVHYGGFRNSCVTKRGAETDPGIMDFIGKSAGVLQSDGVTIIQLAKYKNGVSVEQFSKDGRKFIKMNFPSGQVDTANNNIFDAIVLGSGGRKFTPAQEDLMRAAENLTEKDFECLRMAIDQPTCGVNRSSWWQCTVSDYDVILSAIQHVAGK